MTQTQKNVYIALLAAQATIISLLERVLPNLFAFAPGAKLGLANIVTMLAIFTLSNKDSFKVVTIRVFLSALLGGTFSMFIYSFVGSYLSFFAMILVKRLGPNVVSFVGISACGGIIFNLGQLIVASSIAGSFSIMLYLPVLSVAGIAAGIVVGLIANFLMGNVASIKKMQSEYAKSNSSSLAWYEHSMKSNIS